MAKRKPKPKARGEPAIPPGVAVLLEPKQIAACLAVTDRTLRALRSTGEFPVPDLYLGRLPRWRAETLARWIESRCRR